ncbi:MAG: fumarylacetoacetate hydrolase family protein [Vulcanimicrobiota bacterium]
MEYVITPPSQTWLPVSQHQAAFPVRRIYCVGQNYAEHTKEMGGDPQRNPPFFFSKPAQAAFNGAKFPYPPLSREVHHEIELVVALDRGGSNLSADQALTHIFGYAVGLDMTRRDLQAEAKKAGRPWDAAKGFDFSAPCSPIWTVQQVGHPQSGLIYLDVNGRRAQSGDLGQMIWKVPEIIAHLSTLFTLEPGDLIFTGTPAGVGPVQPGDVLDGAIEGLDQLSLTVVKP